MPEIRPAASLTSSLLARRGDARPAMRRQAISHLHVPLGADEDLGWNDIGEEGEALPSARSSLGLTPPDQVYGSSQDDYEDEDDEQAQAAMSPLSPITKHLEAIAAAMGDVVRDTSSKPVIALRAANVAPRKKAVRRVKAMFGIADRKAAFTLRLDEERHLRLRLLSALTRRSSQQLLIEALDALLAQHDKVEDLAGQIEIDDAGYDETAVE